MFPSTVVDGVDVLQWASQRKSFFAASRYWIFYADDATGDIYFSSSQNGETWVPVLLSPGRSNRSFAVHFDGTYVHYAEVAAVAMGDLYYCRGLPQSDGTILGLDTAVYELVENTVTCGYPSIVVDSAGYVWIGCQYFEPIPLHVHPRVYRNDNTDGTWSTTAGFPIQLSTTSNAFWNVHLLPLQSQRMYVIYVAPGVGERIHGRLYDGGFGAEEDIDSYIGLNSLTAVPIGDNVHVAYLDTYLDDAGDSVLVLEYKARNYATATWSVAEELLGMGVLRGGYTLPYPMMSLDQDTNFIYLFLPNLASDSILLNVYNGRAWSGVVYSFVTGEDIWADPTLNPNNPLTALFKNGVHMDLYWIGNSPLGNNIRFKPLSIITAKYQTASTMP